MKEVYIIQMIKTGSNVLYSLLIFEYGQLSKPRRAEAEARLLGKRIWKLISFLHFSFEEFSVIVKQNLAW